MKKIALLALLIGLFFILPGSSFSQDGGNLAPDGLPNEVYFAPFSLTITPDGDLSDWAGVPRVTMPADADLTSGQPAISFAAAADEQNLYLMADVIDSNIIAGKHDTNYWNEDSVEFYLNATGDLGLQGYQDGVAQITVPAANIGLPTDQTIIAGVNGTTVGANAVVVQTATGYAMEVWLPLHNDVWNITPKHGGVIGFQVHLNGASTGDRDTKLIWSKYDTNDQSYVNPSLFGRLAFFEIGQTEVPEVSTVQVVGPYTIAQRGAGSFTLTKPAGVDAPVSLIYATDDLDKKMATNEWWSSLAWKRRGVASEDMFPHPFAMRAEVDGLALGYPDQPELLDSGRKYQYTYSEELRVGVGDMTGNFSAVRVADFSDWAVTADWNDGRLRATMGHGLPYVYFTKGEGDAWISFSGPVEILANDGGAVLVQINGHFYGIFGPSGSVWTQLNDRLSSSLNGKDYFSVAVLPDGDPATFDLFRAHAYAFVTNTEVSWAYDEAAATVTSTFNVTTDVKEGTEAQPILALYRHQWLYSDAVNTDYTYASPRGEMKVLIGNSFSTVLPFTGILPTLPDVGDYDHAQLTDYLAEIAELTNTRDRLRLPGPDGYSDTYWTGKGMNRLAQLVLIADQLGETDVRDSFLADLKTTLEDWFTVADGDTENLFYYDANWGTLIGYPAANFGYQTSLNDHHFHNGYFIYAASIIAAYDPEWASTDQWGTMVNLLIKDAADPQADRMFPRLRNFDPYAGHSWASGAQETESGANQESSSEAINFATAAILWGEATGNTELRDLGIFLYANEVVAIKQYWFDEDDAVFPADFAHNALGIVWSDGGAYTTWFSTTPEAIHAINFLPITGGSLYLGHDPDYIVRNYQHMQAEIGGTEDAYQDMIWEALALGDPEAALAQFGTGSYDPEWGETKAHTFHWLNNIAALGHADPSITADTPIYAVFDRAGVKTYVAYNYGAETRTVTFSDGTVLDVEPHSYGVMFSVN